jgi:hypothetical protein
MLASLPRAKNSIGAFLRQARLRLFVQRFAVVALLFAQISLSLHLIDHAAESGSLAPDCAICAMAGTGAAPVDAVSVPPPDFAWVDQYTASIPAPADFSAPASFRARAPPISQLI